MEDSEKIIGDGVPQLIQQLKKDNTLIKVRLRDEDYEELTLVRGVRSKDKTAYFLVDYPRGFRDAIAEVDECFMKVWKRGVDIAEVHGIDVSGSAEMTDGADDILACAVRPDHVPPSADTELNTGIRAVMRNFHRPLKCPVASKELRHTAQ